MSDDQPEVGDTFTVNVTAKDLEEGGTQHPRFCPVAKALERAGVCADAQVGSIISQRERVTCFEVIDPPDYIEAVDGGRAGPERVTVRVVKKYAHPDDVPEVSA